MPDTWAPNPKISSNDVTFTQIWHCGCKKGGPSSKGFSIIIGMRLLLYLTLLIHLDDSNKEHINAKWRLPQKESETEHCQSVYVSWTADNELNVLCIRLC